MKWHFGIAGVGMENWKLVAYTTRHTHGLSSCQDTVTCDLGLCHCQQIVPRWIQACQPEQYAELVKIRVLHGCLLKRLKLIDGTSILKYATILCSVRFPSPMETHDCIRWCVSNENTLSLHSWFLSIVLRWLAKCVTILFSHIHTRMQRIRLHTLAFNILQWLKVTFAFPIWQSF